MSPRILSSLNSRSKLSPRQTNENINCTRLFISLLDCMNLEITLILVSVKYFSYSFPNSDSISVSFGASSPFKRPSVVIFYLSNVRSSGTQHVS